MALIRWEPSRQGGDLQSLQREFNRLFGTVFDSQTGAATPARRWVPAVDILEEEDRYALRADLPGMSEQDVAIEIEDGVLTVSGERGSEQEQQKGSYRRIERFSGSFSRSVRLPRGVDPEAIEATFADGVLEVSIPKPEQAKPRRVAIKAARRAQVQAPAGEQS